MDLTAKKRNANKRFTSPFDLFKKRNLMADTLAQKSIAVFKNVCLLLLVFIMSQPVAAQYTLQDEDVSIVNGVIDSCFYDFEQTDIIIPEILQGQTVIEIGDRASAFDKSGFSYRGITSLQLPSTIEYIGYYAFRDNALSALDLSNCVNLKQMSIEAFCRNTLTSIDLSGCSSLEYIGNNCFRVNYLTDVNLNGCTGLKIIGLNVFKENSLSYVDISGCKSLELIDYGAFSSNAGLDGIILPVSEKPGFELTNWLASNEDVFLGGDYINNLGISYTAQFGVANYTIRYNLDGGTHSNVLEYMMGETPITLQPAEKDNYVFMGWYDNAEFTGYPITTLSTGTYGDLEFWAYFRETGYLINYNADGGIHGNVTEYTPITIPLTLVDATKDGYTFLGWFDNADLSGDAVTEIAFGTIGDLEFWSKWEVFVGVSDFVKKLDVYPNPAKGELTINHNDVNVKNIKVFNTTGQFVLEVSQPGISTTTIDLTNYDDGLYYLVLSTNNGEVITRKFITSK